MNKATLLFLLNIADALLTLYWLEVGAATEGNFIMNFFLGYGVPVFLTVKVLMAATASLTLEYGQKYRVARFGLNFAVVIYGLLMLVHLATGISYFLIK